MIKYFFRNNFGAKFYNIKMQRSAEIDYESYARSMRGVLSGP